MKNEYQTSVSLNYWMSMNFNGKDFAMSDELLKYVKTDNVFDDACEIIEVAQKVAYKAISLSLLQRNWLLGKRIAEDEAPGENRSGHY